MVECLKSLVSDRKYVRIGLKEFGEDKIKVLAQDGSDCYEFVIGNVPEDFVAWLKYREHTLESPLDEMYVPAQATVYTDRGVVHVQVATEDDSYNRPYGAAFNISCEKLFDVIQSMLDKCVDAEVDGEFIC